ncbi:hypothetical protein FRACYDRAFT_234689 [Fragilariopsis cylindrus CCMP1102]|uniref:Gpi16-domain-containing protein n=1 Tax=Fragilariopsis cylindrus CCMP1102 TaxID=635003 RepID=A0A1E7FTB8_9STRA|nr:hypothetical protein FRACYDRAFT_234689 [Fragilariopsis cylindrus CCMP1102]|eukprot:OEU21063.1 hypothetical protein FRACYDRAFT_234689 [Fragilariopsis cylindrus CCMP1102]
MPLFSYEERLLMSSSSSSSPTGIKTVRLESLAHWKDNAWINPFSDIDIDSISYSNGIAQVHMSIGSHPTKRFPSSASSYGFFLSIKPVDGLTPEEEAKAVQTVFEELLRRRLITTPVTGAKWDIIVDNNATEKLSVDSSLSSRLYQIILPFSGAALSSDALEQSFRTTLPAICNGGGGGGIGGGSSDHSKKMHHKFFGWNALEWSNFLVGYGDIGGNDTYNNNNNNNKDKQQPPQYPTYNKLLWWTWTSSTASSKRKSNKKSLSFGIQYQTFVPTSTDSNTNTTKNSWLPDVFLEESLSCPIGKRNAFRVESLPHESKTTASGYRLEPLQTTTKTINDNTNNDEESLLLLPGPTFPYEANIDQVLRRHHTNQGRFESVIDLRPLFDHQNDYFLSLSCRMKYRQVLPDFLSPMWRSLEVVDTTTATTGNNGDGDGDGNYSDDTTPFYSSSEQVQASVEWNSDDRSSILYVEAFSGPQSSSPELKQEQNKIFLFLPSTLAISFEYGPSFLTLDDFPGDPNRGRELPPGRVTVQCNQPPPPVSHHTTTIRSPDLVMVYSNSLILLPPVPDMSMPFNVISLTSSLYAYIVGAVVTILVRKASEKIKYKLYPEKKPISKVQNLKNKLKAKVDLIKIKFLRSKTSTSSDNSTENNTKDNGDNTESTKETTMTTTALEFIDIGNQATDETASGNRA